MLLNLPPEVVQVMVSLLQSPRDLNNLRLVCTKLRDIIDHDCVWSKLCRDQFGVSISTQDDFGPREYYQHFAHKFGPYVGLWQRKNLKFYGGLLKVTFCPESKSLLLTNLIPNSDIKQDLREQVFLTISLGEDHEIIITNHDILTSKEKAEIHFSPDSEEELSVAIPSMIDYIASPAEWRDLLDHFRAWDTTANTESALMKFVSVYHSRNMFTFSRVLTPEWVTEHHGDHVSGSPQLTSLAPGLFKGMYGAHGVELVHLNDGQVVKVTGDPNVPFNQVTFRVTMKNKIVLPLEMQENLDDIIQATVVDYQEYMIDGDNDSDNYDFLVPESMNERIPIPHRKCLGRWVGEAQIAAHMFVDSSFIPANFILFSQDEFAVMFLDLNCISMFYRVQS